MRAPGKRRRAAGSRQSERGREGRPFADDTLDLDADLMQFGDFADDGQPSSVPTICAATPASRRGRMCSRSAREMPIPSSRTARMSASSLCVVSRVKAPPWSETFTVVLIKVVRACSSRSRSPITRERAMSSSRTRRCRARAELVTHCREARTLVLVLSLQGIALLLHRRLTRSIRLMSRSVMKRPLKLDQALRS